MRLKPVWLGLASASAAAILWLICSFLVFILPGMMMRMTGTMFHADFSGLNWILTFKGVLTGLISWSIVAGISGWLLAFIYNAIAKD